MINYYFGAPGAGKTSLAVREVLQYKKRGLWTFTNFGCLCADKDSNDFNLEGLGSWTFPKCSYIAIDESAIEYNNRAWKNFTPDEISFYRKYRHYLGEVSVISLFSQGWDDTEKTLRILADRYYYLRKFGFFTLKRRMFKGLVIDKTTGQPRDNFKFVSIFYLIFKPVYYISFLIPGIGHLFRLLLPNFREIELVFRPLYYKYFDSYECDDLLCPFDLEEMLEARRVNSSSNRIKGMLRSCAAHVRRIISKGVKTPTKK